MARARVLIACPNGSGLLHKDVALAVIRMLQDPRVESSFVAPTLAPYVANLHQVAQEAIRREFDYLLTIDDDNPPTNNPLDLVALGLDVVGLPTPIWKNLRRGDRPVCFNAMRDVSRQGEEPDFRPLDSQPGFRQAGLQEADAVGSGCVLIARRVLVELFRRVEASGDVRELPFMRRWNLDGSVEISGDFAFCLRARAAGFRVWAHFDYCCQHYVTLELTEANNALTRPGGGRA